MGSSTLPKFGPGEDLVLLTLLLAPSARAREHWREWESRSDLDDITWPAQQILPMVLKRLDEVDIDHRWMGRMRGIHRQGWTKNQINRRACDLAIDSLVSASVEVVVPGDRQIGDLFPDPDVFVLDVPRLTVPWARSGEALAVLLDNGWSIRAEAGGPRSVVGRLRQTRWRLEHDIGALDLANHYNPWIHDGRGDDAVWERATGDASGLRLDAGFSDLLVVALLDSPLAPASMRWALAYRVVEAAATQAVDVAEVLDRRPADATLDCIESRLTFLADADSSTESAAHLSTVGPLAARARGRALAPFPRASLPRRLVARPGEVHRGLRRHGGALGALRYLKQTASAEPL